MWSLLVMSEEGGWLAHRRAEVKKPEYVQVVELPPGYKAPQNSKTPPSKPKRYADKTSVVDVEQIPGHKAALTTPPGSARAEQKAGAKKTSKASKAAKAVSAKKKVAGSSKPRRVFKAKKNPPREKRTKKTEKSREQKRFADSKKPAEKTTHLKEAKLREAVIEPVSEGDMILKSNKIKTLEKSGKLKASPKKKEVSAAKRKDTSEIWRTEAGRSGAAASTPSPLSRPNLLLSEDQVTMLSRQYQGSAPASKSKTLMLNTSELKYQSYLIELKHKIEQYWEYPRLAAMRGWEGKLFINMTIQRDGTLSEIKLSRSSRYPVLDDAAITAIKLASPFTTFPKDFDIKEINIHGQFVYTLIGPPR